MPSTTAGTGTAYVGARDRDREGWFTTTLWVVIAYLPVLPLRSYRARHVFRRSLDGGPQLAVSRIPLQWGHVGRTYARVLLLVALLAALLVVAVCMGLTARQQGVVVALGIALLLACNCGLNRAR